MSKDNTRKALSRMRLKEKLALVCGGLDISSADLSDAFLPTEPSALALGCSFSAELCAKVSERRANGAMACKKAVAGAIGAGLITEPMDIDAVEYFSEDAELARILLKAYSDSALGYIFYGALGQGEYNIRTVDSRALNEIYLYPISHAGKNAAGLLLDGGALNGERVDGSRKLFDDFATMLNDHAVILSRGDDVTGAYLLCDGTKGKAIKKQIKREIAAGELHESIIDKTVRRTMEFAARADKFYTSPHERTSKNGLTDTDIFSETAVLLKNSVLPIADKNIVFFGDGGYFDDGEKFDVRDISSAQPVDGLAVFALTDYADGIDRRTVAAISECAARGKTVVAFCGGAACPIEFSAEAVGAVLFCPYVTKLDDLTKLVTGEISPCGHLPFAWCNSRRDNPRATPRFDDRGDYRYESVYNGYMYYENFAKSAIMFPFGHGLDYTDYQIAAVKATCRDRDIVVECDVKNVGGRQGTATIQAYASYVGDGVYGLRKRFAAFERVALAAGETKRVALKVNSDRLTVYDEENGAFVPIGGKFVIDVGLSAADIRGSVTVKPTGENKLKSSATPSELPTYYGVNAASRSFCPSAPELEKLFGVPFISKPDLSVVSIPRVSKFTALKLKRKTPARCVKLLEHKLNISRN